MRALASLWLALPLCAGCYASHVDADPPPPRPRACLELRDQGIVSGLRADSERWTRPAGGAFGCGPSDQRVRREVYVFCNRGGDAVYEIALDGAGADPTLTLTDPFLVVYDGNGIPADATDCLAADDDGGEGLGSRLEVGVPADATLTVVATSFADATGTFQLRLRPLD